MGKIRFKQILMIVTGMLLIPMIAMQFTEEVNWGMADFLIGGFTLLFAGMGIDYFLREIKNPKLKIIFILLVVMFILLLWAELAVGVFS